MRFLSKECCEKLVKMGCKNTDFFYVPGEAVPVWRYKVHCDDVLDETWVSAFTLEDFISTDEYAKENCKKIWKEKAFYEGNHNLIKYIFLRRIEIISSTDWATYIENAVKEKEVEE